MKQFQKAISPENSVDLELLKKKKLQPPPDQKETPVNIIKELVSKETSVTAEATEIIEQQQIPQINNTTNNESEQPQLPYSNIKPQAVRMSNEEIESQIKSMDKLRQISYTARYNPKHPVNTLTIACRNLSGFTPPQSWFHNVIVDVFQDILEKTPELYDKLYLIKDTCEGYSPRESNAQQEMMNEYIRSIFKEHIK
jgi:hypothetical protein